MERIHAGHFAFNASIQTDMRVEPKLELYNSIIYSVQFLPSFPPALQLRVSFGILNNRSPSKSDCLVSEQFNFYGVRLLASRPTPKLEDLGTPLRLALTL
jgi:hypothetical protein